MAVPTIDQLKQVYGVAAEKAAERLKVLENRYIDRFGEADLEFFSAPGRTEIIGNHTDHNGGKILAASITMDTIAAAAPNGTNTIEIVSEGYSQPIVFDVDAVETIPPCQGSLSLVAGMVRALRDRKYRVAGFNATVSSEVIPSAGVSSSASFEMLIIQVIDHLFNNDSIERVDYAYIGQYAENVYWKKASGLMDQMACAVGGTIVLDFSDGVKYEKVDFSFDSLGCDLVIVNTGKGHADLSEEYSSVPQEMHAIANVFGVEQLSQISEDDLLRRLPEVRERVGSDRAVLRALHFFEECGRVDKAVQALHEGNRSEVLNLIEASGNSSWKWLQNAYVSSDPAEQSIPLALALTEIYLRRLGRGVCRLHGGGFAGVIMCVVPSEHTQDYVEYMAPYVGIENIYRTNIRQVGAACLNAGA
ncbi:MAG TPA: galactokinase [Candidatus Coprovicinus avistercoris]|uniref:Galactokinase n=1 Tax=Candidatus Coprovicinus avistercoris TaxID=2840754 RepID=A0A9D1L4N6_9ACTN|nr:galactokinase [Candidatus Coprovicinus avistercoris]